MKNKLIYRQSKYTKEDGLVEWKDLSDEYYDTIYEEFNHLNEIIFCI